MRRHKIILTIGIILAASGMLGYLIWPFVATPNEVENEGGNPEEAAEAAPTTLNLTPEQVEKGNLEIKSATPGTLNVSLLLFGKIVPNPDTYAHIVTKASGVVKQVYKNIGDPVKEGELLAVLESKEMAEMKAAYFGAKKRDQLAQTLYEKEKSLYEKKIGTEQEFLQAESAAEQAHIDLELAKQSLYSLGLSEADIAAVVPVASPNFRILEIRAPFNGTVIDRHLTNGEFVDSSQEAFIIADLSNVWVELGIYPKDVSIVQEGQNVEIFNDAGTHSQAKIIRLHPILESESSRTKALALMDNSKGTWRPGTYVCGNLKKSEIKVPVVVSKEAVMNIEDVDCLFVAKDNGFEKRNVLTGRSDDNNIEIVSGLEPGERYVAKNAFILKFELTKGEPD